MTQTISKPRRLLPGMLCNAIEFFNNNSTLKVIMNGTVKKFNQLPTPVYQLAIEELKRNTEAHTILKEWFPESELQQVEKFVSCRYGDLGTEGDIVDGKFSAPEFWDCPMRGKCKGEGSICAMPNYHGQTLSETEVKLLQLLTTPMTNEAIAAELNAPLGTFHQLKQKLYAKLGGIQTKQEATLIALDLNLI